MKGLPLGIIPGALSGSFGKENRGFGLGVLPGLLYKDKYKSDQEEEEKKKREENASTGSVSTSLPSASKMKKGGTVKAKSASARADGIAQRGKTKGRII